MPKEALFPEQTTPGFKPRDPDAITPTGANEQGLTEDDEIQATPEEQAQYEQAIDIARKMIIGEKAKTKEIVKKMNNPRRPVHEAVGDVVAQIGGVIINSMESAGETADPSLMLMAAEDYLIPTLFEVGEIAGVIPKMSPEDEQKEMQLTLLHAQSVYGNKAAKEGRLPTAEARQILGEQLDKEGQGYSLDAFLKDSGGSQEETPRQPQGGPPSQLKPLAEAVRNPGSGSGTLGGDLFNG